MLRRILMLMALALALMATVPTPVAAYGNTEVQRFKTLSPSQYTNGTEKSFLVTWSFSACNQVFADVEIRFYYDILNATRIRITKAVVKYYIGGSTKRIYGGPLEAGGSNGIVGIGTSLGDYNTPYIYSGQPRDPDGYAYVGTYTHWGPAVIYGHDDDNGEWAYLMKSGVTAWNSTCSTDWMDLTLFLHW